MFKTLASAVALIAGAALSFPVAAQTFTPAPTVVEFSGPLTILSSGVTCEMRFTATIDSAGAATVSNPGFDPGDFACAFVSPLGSWTLETVLGTTTTVELGFGYTYGAFSCFSPVVLSFTGGTTATIDPINVVLAPVGSSPPCYVQGFVESDGPLAIGF